MKIHSDSEFLDGFIEGAARAFFVMAYASYVEEADSSGNELTDDERAKRKALPYASNGGDWYDYAPATPVYAYVLAGEMIARIRADKRNGGCGIYSLRERAEQADGEAPDPEDFGRDIAMRYMGTGVSWFDDHEQFECHIPYTEISAYTFDSAAYEGQE